MNKKPVILGLTGSIGMGKSFVTAQFASLGAATCNADEFVHKLLAKGGRAVMEVGMQFPDVVEDGAVDRKKLGEIVFTYPDKLKILEDILHPFVFKMEKEFADAAAAAGAKLVVMDIPLLFEKNGQKRVDHTLVVTAPPAVQKKRVLARQGMSERRFARILAAQMPDAEKQARADFIVRTGYGKAYSLWQVKRIFKKLTAVKK